jgi:phage shock protein B
MSDEMIPVFICAILFLGLPGIVLHYMAQFRKAKGITIEDENLLDDLHDTARRLDARLDSIERIIAADNPDWKAGALASARSTDRLTDQAEPRLSIRR